MSEPVRTCIGCRARASAKALVRIAWDDAAPGVVIDVRRRLGGRGAWLHPDPSCLDHALRRRAIGRALRRAVAPGDTAGLASQLDATVGRQPVGPTGE